MSLTFRIMKADEAKTVQSLGIKSFLRSFEGSYVSMPKTAIVAEKDGKIIGGFLYEIENVGEIKIGFIDFFFVEPKHTGQGVGHALCKEGIAYMWAEGCDYLTTFVRDDNVGSWLAFEKAGFTRASIPKIAKALGFGGFIKAYVKHIYGLAVGFDFYFAMRPENPAALSAYAKKTGINQIAFHILINMMLVMIMTLSVAGISNIAADPSLIISQLPVMLLSLLIIFGGVIFFSFIGTIFSSRKWHYRMPAGGLLLTLITAVLGVFLPMAGNWYPDRYEKTAKFRIDMGISAALPWIYLIGLLAAARLLSDEAQFWRNVFHPEASSIIAALLIFRCMPIPIINLGSVRVFRWNKILCVIMVMASIFLVYFW